jgi:hypothetical protein
MIGNVAPRIGINTRNPRVRHALPVVALLLSPSAHGYTTYGWDVTPTVATRTSQRTGCLPPPAGPLECFENNPITTVVAHLSGGRYGVDVNDDGVRDGTLTADAEIVSEVQQNLDGTYDYFWQITNRGTGSVMQIVGGNPAGLAVSTAAPLLGRAGLDRIAGTADDPPNDQFIRGTLLGVRGAPRQEGMGIIANPSSGFIIPILAPTPSTLFDWDSTPNAVTTDYHRDGCLPGVDPCTTPRPITGRSCRVGGTYGIDYTGDGVRDGTMIADARITSEVEALADGTYMYWWQIANLGSGPFNSYVGPNTPQFEISSTAPVLLVPIERTLASTYPPGSEASGIIPNPSTGDACTILSPTAPHLTIAGFRPPVDASPIVNVVRNGATVPLKFEIFDGSVEQTSTGLVKQLTAAETPCSNNATDEVELVASGATSLRYDTSAGEFIYNWKTPAKPGYCYRVTVTLTDGASESAEFRLK